MLSVSGFLSSSRKFGMSIECVAERSRRTPLRYQSAQGPECAGSGYLTTIVTSQSRLKLFAERRDYRLSHRRSRAEREVPSPELSRY